MRRTRALSAMGAAVVVAGAVATLAISQSAQAATGAPLPAHVFAPYFEAYQGDSLSGLAQQSGNKYLTMAFIQTPSQGSCTAYWNGDPSMPLASSTFGSDISAMQAGGGNVVPSFGGFAADDTGTEIADSCTNVASIAAQYEKVITTYNVTRIDLDTEDNSLTNSAGIDRRNKAIKQVEDWAVSNGRTVQFVYTLPTTTHGLDSKGLAVLQNAVANSARIDVVNIMTFDYYDGASHEMANDTKTAAAGLVGQLQQLYPGRTSAQLWGMVGVTEMPGIDDFGSAETFTTADAPAVESWAASQGIAELSFWALQRDNGGCPGSGASDTCSGVPQSTWQFSHAFEPFTSGAGTSSPTPPPTRSASASPTPSHPASASPTPSHPASPTPTPTGGGGTGVTNGGFESGSLSPWTCTGGLGSVVSSPVHSGTRALKAAASSSDDAQCTQSITVTPNHAYTLSAWVEGNYAFIGTTGAASDVSTWTASAPGYTKLSVSFTSGSSGHLQIWVHGWYGTGTIDVDDVTVG
ncbi:glycosyl hydrolase family 18 protein [Rugosimonospora acidiphila]|uniref:Glycosyl hydrolase family 18 protein n=1 Tax=Rugosimonospora acidiphila TaxID=556531 RepID=A0ABP9RN26_9ACTN